MPDIDPRQDIRLRLSALSLDNYRAARWRAIDAARTLGMTWMEIAEALDADHNVVRRWWNKGEQG